MQFATNAAGVVRKQPTGYWAFIPAPLPPTIEYGPTLIRQLSEADAALGELSGLGRYLPNPDLLIRPYVQREALASSRIEGTQAELSDMLLNELEGRDPPNTDVREVRNYIRALNLGLARLGTLPISGRLLREMHAVLMDGVRGQERTPGEFRRSQNWIGPPGSTLTTATYVPPPHDPDMMDCLGRWEAFAQVRGALPDLLQCALLHEHFEAIHPFLDGNGRIGRLLIPLFLIERGRLSQPLLYVSSRIEGSREEYYERLQRIRTHGDWPGWFDYFLTAVRDAARDAIAQGDRIVKLRDEYRRKLADQPRALPLVEELFVNPYIRTGRTAKVLKVSTPTALKVLRTLVERELLEPAAAPGIWFAEPILRVLQDDQSE